MEANTTAHHTRSTQLLYTYRSSSPRQASESAKLKFMSFNMQSGFKESCQSDVDAQLAFARGEAPDYLASQEVVQNVYARCNCNMPQMIANTLGMTSSFTMGIPYGGGQYGTNLASTQNVLETRYKQLMFSGIEQRIVGAIRTQPKGLQGRNVWYVNGHVDWFNWSGRKSQVEQILDFIASILASDSRAIIVMAGDFNGEAGDIGYNLIKQAGFTNVWDAATGSTEGGKTYPAGSPGNRFDHIWYKIPNGVSVRPEIAVINTKVSDHRPLVGTLEFSFSGAEQQPEEESEDPFVPVSTDRIICVGPIYENVGVTISCPGNLIMRQATYANYGLTTGSCGNYRVGSIVGGSSVAVVNNKCVGRRSCQFVVSNNVFGDPKPGVGKTFFAQVLCRQ